MIYERIQLSPIDRHRNFIEAAKVVNIQGNNLTIERFNGNKETFPVNYMDYEIGEFIDIQFIRTGSSSHALKLIGHTPEKFYPDEK